MYLFTSEDGLEWNTTSTYVYRQTPVFKTITDRLPEEEVLMKDIHGVGVIGPKSVGHVARFVLDHAPCPVLLARLASKG